MPKCIIDFRMRDIEKAYLQSLGYELLETQFFQNTYDEISFHPDVFYTKVNNIIFCEPDITNFGLSFVKGITKVKRNYPEDIPYNLAIIGKYAVHNFKYTDEVLKRYLESSHFECVQVEQGYTKCSICVLDNESLITSDIKIAVKLSELGLDVLFVAEQDIKLLKRTSSIFIDKRKMSFEYSNMQGFIGGALVKLKNTVVLFGDINKLTNGRKIQKFIENKGYNFKYFEGLDVIDYGGVIEVDE